MLTGSAAASLAAVLAGYPDGPARLATALARDVGGIPIKEPIPETFAFSVEREADLVLLDITFHGFYLNSGPGEETSLVPAGTGNVIVVQFPPQAIGEAVYEYAADGEEPPWYVDPPPVMSVVAGPSRLCFTLASGQQVDFPTMTAADLLDWSSWTLLVPSVAQSHEGGVIGVEVPLDHSAGGAAARRSEARPGFKASEPGPLVTSIEYPYGLFLAPTVDIGAVLFGFTTRFNARQEPLFGEHAPGGGSLGGAQVTPISDCWTAALEVTTFDHQHPVIGLHGVEYIPPPPPVRKPEVAAVYARDFDTLKYGPNGATPETYINYEREFIGVKRPGSRQPAAAASGGDAATAGSNGRAPHPKSKRARPQRRRARRPRQRKP